MDRVLMNKKGLYFKENLLMVKQMDKEAAILKTEQFKKETIGLDIEGMAMVKIIMIMDNPMLAILKIRKNVDLENIPF